MVRRPLLRAAMIVGVGYLLGRRSSEPAAQPTSATGTAARLAELDQLRAAGTITADEYETKRADLLREL